MAAPVGVCSSLGYRSAARQCVTCARPSKVARLGRIVLPRQGGLVSSGAATGSICRRKRRWDGVAGGIPTRAYVTNRPVAAHLVTVSVLKPLMVAASDPGGDFVTF